MTTREPIRFECPYCAQIVGDYVTGTAHDKLVAELMARLVTLEAVVRNEIPKLERLESWLQIQCVASPSAKTTALRDAAQYSLRDLRHAIQPKDPPMTHITDERLLSIRKQYSYRAYGESRDENDDVANELADVASAITELLAARAEVARLTKERDEERAWKDERGKALGLSMDNAVALAAERNERSAQLITAFGESEQLRAEVTRLQRRCADMESASEDRCLSQEHAHAMQHLSDYGNNDIARIEAEIARDRLSTSVATLTSEVTRLQSALATSFCDLRSDLLHMTQRCAEATDHVATLTSALEEANVDREAMRANDARWRYSRICGWPNDSSISGDELDRITDAQLALTQEKRGG